MNASLNILINKLAAAYGHGEARATMQLLVEDLLEKSWSKLAARIVSPNEEEYTRLEEAVDSILSGRPPQHITGKGWFYGRYFHVNSHVLIPRPETEELVAWVLSEQPNRLWRGLDIGTGSGCIPISLMCESRYARMEGLDVSEPALELAKRNAELYKAEVIYSCYNMLNWKKDDFKGLDIVISNPPYIPRSEAAGLATRVRDYEPGIALFVPDHDPLLFYQKISQAARFWLKPGGKLFFEIHEDYGEEVKKILLDHNFSEVALRKDMQGRNRMVAGKKPD